MDLFRPVDAGESVTAAFDRLPLGGRERLSAIAGVIAVAAARRQGGAARELLPRLFELARPDPAGAAPALACAEHVLDRRRIAAAQSCLDDALAQLAALLDAEGVGQREAGFVETIVLARLLGAHSPDAIRGALATVGRAVADPCFEPGEILIVPAADAQSSS